ncbi:MAG TPA: ABC transporter permease [Candidatus Acidoferrum sp.]|nr:ABC transporter permease [Candidatus Acidoferrum sp.]
MSGWLRQTVLRCASLFRGAKLDQDLDGEMSLHLDLAIKENLESGMTPDEARRQALIQFGGTQQAKENHRDARGLPGLETLLQDSRFAFRMLRKNPGFTAIAVLTLALGIGANSALFSVVNGVLLNPLPYHDPDKLIAVYTKTTEFSTSTISYPNFLDWQRDNRSFSSLAAFRPEDFNLTGMSDAERLTGNMVSATFFPLLGIRPIAGRVFTEQDDQVGAEPVVLISQKLWKSKFASSRETIGKSITLNGTLYTVVGVIPATFHYQHDNFQMNSDLYVPIGQWNDPTFRDRSTRMGTDAVGRLKPGVTLEQAKLDMDRVASHLADIYPEVDKDSGINLLPLKENLVGDVRPILLILLAAVGFVLLIACANVANLLLARSTGRKREFAIRSALGAGTNRVLRQLLTESMLLALAGGALGMLVAAWGTQAAIKLLPEALPRADEIHLDAQVLLFTLAASVFAGILFGVVPAFKSSRTEIRETLKEAGRGGSAARHHTHSIFVAVQMALALVLLVGAGLMLRTLTKLWSVDPGINANNVVTFNIASAQPVGSTPEATRVAFQQLHDSIRAVPGVEAASLTIGSSIMNGDSMVPFWLEGQPKPESQSEMNSTLFYVTQSEYLDVMGIPLKRGRFLAESDNAHSPTVMVIDQQFAKRYFGDKDPTGAHVNLAILNISAQIVGVVGHIKQWGLDSDDTAKVQAQCYIPISQIPESVLPLFDRSFNAVVRTGGQPLASMDSIRHAVQQVNSQIVVSGTQTISGVIRDSLADKRFLMILLGVFAALAMLLSSIGIYGVISCLVGQRTQEIGIRMALGAERMNVLRMVLGQAGKMIIFGIAIGILATLGLTRLMAAMLFRVSPWDPATLAGVVVLLSVVSLLAGYIPARRATKVDPVIALRYE